MLNIVNGVPEIQVHYLVQLLRDGELMFEHDLGKIHTRHTIHQKKKHNRHINFFFFSLKNIQWKHVFPENYHVAILKIASPILPNHVPISLSPCNQTQGLDHRCK